MRLGSVKTCKPSVSSLAVTLAFRYICPQIYKKYGERCKLLAFISVFYRHRDTQQPTTTHTARNNHQTLCHMQRKECRRHSNKDHILL